MERKHLNVKDLEKRMLREDPIVAWKEVVSG